MKAQVTTKRLVLHPLSDDELNSLINETEDEGLKGAYTEMLNNASTDNNNRNWYVPWAIELKKINTRVGYVGFHGPVNNDAVEIGCGIFPEHERNGYATEAAKSMIEWAFNNESVIFVEAESDSENAASLAVINKLGFTQYKMGEEGPRFEKVRPDSLWLSVFMCIGLSLGISIGNLVFDNMATGMGMGIAVGVGIGVYLDDKDKKRISAARERRKLEN